MQAPHWDKDSEALLDVAFTFPAVYSLLNVPLISDLFLCSNSYYVLVHLGSVEELTFLHSKITSVLHKICLRCCGSGARQPWDSSKRKDCTVLGMNHMAH